MKKLNVVLLAGGIFLLALALVLSVLASLNTAPIGIIGSADGPTAIYIGENLKPGRFYLLLRMGLILLAIVLLRMVKGKRNN